MMLFTRVMNAVLTTLKKNMHKVVLAYAIVLYAAVVLVMLCINRDGLPNQCVIFTQLFFPV